MQELPGIGKKSARNLALYLSLQGRQQALKLSEILKQVHMQIQSCQYCMGFSAAAICDVCSNENRDNKTLCLVLDIKDMLTLEESKIFNGKYFILGDYQAQMASLRTRVKDGVCEVVFAFAPSLANESIICYIEEQLKDLQLSFSKIAWGIPTGISLENVDILSLTKALNDRVKV